VYFFLALSPAPFHLVNGLGRPGLNTLFYVMNALLNVAFLVAAAVTDGMRSPLVSESRVRIFQNPGNIGPVRYLPKTFKNWTA